MNWQAEALLALQVVLATVLGGLVGWQREHLGIEAGVRTFASVSLGACVFGLIYPSDTRIAAQIVTGIGFLGAGVITLKFLEGTPRRQSADRSQLVDE